MVCSRCGDTVHWYGEYGECLGCGAPYEIRATELQKAEGDHDSAVWSGEDRDRDKGTGEVAVQEVVCDNQPGSYFKK